MLFLETLYSLGGPLVPARTIRELAAKRDLKRLQGDWVLASLEEDGKAATEARRREFKVWVAANGRYVFQAGSEICTGYYQLDPTQTPRALDIILEDGPDKGKVQLAIYDFDGEQRKIAVAEPGRPRPQGFAPAAGINIEVWKRR
jgi:uncharacterized protein (TIGR03067 family)